MSIVDHVENVAQLLAHQQPDRGSNVLASDAGATRNATVADHAVPDVLIDESQRSDIDFQCVQASRGR